MLNTLKRGYFIAGTDTDVGKTVAASWLMIHLGADYWKPVQSGTKEVDVKTVEQISGMTSDHFHPSTYELIDPLSPHEAAKRMGIALDQNRFQLPQSPRPIIAEGAGGLLVPINEKFLVIDLIAKLGLPIILVARSRLGTINHTLLSLEAIRARNLPLLGVVMNGVLMPHNKEAIETYGKVKVLAEIPHMDQIDADKLRHIKPHIPFSRWNESDLKQLAA